MSTPETRPRTAPDADAAAVRKAISSAGRPPRADARTAAAAFGWRGMLKIKHVPEQLIDVTITPVLFTLLFTYMFGGAIAGSAADYLQFLLPGILVMSVLFSTVYSGVALNTDMTKGVVDRFRSLPIWSPAPLVGAVVGDSVRYVLAGTIVVIVGVILGYSPEGGVESIIAAMALVAEGTTVLLCTQYLEEADQLADGIVVIDHGRVIAEGTPGQLKASVGSGALHVRLLDPDQRPEAERILSRELGSVHLEPDPTALSASCADTDKAAEAIAEISRSGIGIADFSLGQPSLDEVFLALTGHTAEDQTQNGAPAEEEQAA